MTDFSERLAALSPEQRALFELRRKQKGLSEAQNQTISRRKPAPHYPLSFDQMRLWFLYQLAPNNSAYNITGGVRLTGLINPDVLERSLNEIIRRHEILRTTFANVDEQPVQVIAPQLTIKIAQVDLSHLPPEERALAMPRVATEHAQVPFDLIDGPLIRASLLRLAADDHVLITTMHHIVTDRWSYTLFEQELAILYHAFSSRLPSPLPELPIQFADFAIWQQQWMQSQKMQEQLDFWKRKLVNLPPIHQIPTDHPRPTVVSFLGGRQEVELPLSSVQGVRSLARQSGATIFITLLTMFKVLLARQSGQTDIIVGTPIANRGRPELEKLIGFFLNTLIFRSDLSANPTFREYLAQVREIASEAYAYQDVPFERLVAELRPERDTSRNPLYQISFLFLDFEDPQELADLPNVKVKTIDVDTYDARFDLTFALWSGPDSIYGVFEYSSDLFEAATIATFAEHFKLLVAEIVANPDLRVFDIPCLTKEEERKLLVDWNATAGEYPQDRCVHELIAEQANRTPEAVAVVFEDRSLSYAELDARANQLAQHLRSLGVSAETRVGVYLQRSPELLVALLGILKAGAAYVPLDPSYPAARLEFMLADAGIGVLVTQAALAENLPHTGIALCLDRDADQIAQQPPTPPSSALQPEDLAYIIYTSGSTGQPKGVQIPHRALVNFLHAMQREPGITTDDTLLAVTTIAFDIAGLELFLPLTVGSRIVLVDRDTAIDGARLAALLTSSGATIMQATPATWRLLLAAGWSGAPGLRALCGGEALPWDLAQHLLPRVDQLWNLYGPTETTIWSAATRVRAEDGRISLGQPIANTRLYVLDPQQRLVPIGVVGELYIGGDGIARGYNNRPDLTAERFVPAPFGAAGSRLYRTGDLVRYRADGSLEFHGRVDHQIKLRGYRIELGEIEAALRQQPEVRDVAVMVREDRAGDQRLVAYVVGEQRNKGTKEQANQESITTPLLLPGVPSAPGEGLGDEGLTNHRGDDLSERLSMALRAKLPEYMVPSAFVLLDALPLTPNGKLDRKALPAPDARSTVGGALVAPRNPTEELVAGVWSAALDVEQIGVHDNFFALGGHSLMATQVIGRVKQLLNLDLPLRLLFEAPTVATFAARLQAQQADAGAQLQPVPRDGTPLPLSFAQQRLWFLDQLQPNSSAYNLLTAARLRGSLNLDAFRRSLATIAQRHESLRTTFTQRVPEIDQLGVPVQIIAPTLEVPLDVVSIQALPEAEREAALMQLVRDEADRPFDLQRGPLLRAQLVQIAETEHVLLLTIHHIISDGWSQSILLRELTTLYQGFVQHEPATLPELPIQYADYSVWQRNWLSGAVLEQQIDYWRNQLTNLAPLDLPTDYPRPPVVTYEGAHTAFQIGPELSAELQRLSQQLGATLFMTLLAGFQSLLSRYSGQTDIAVGTPIAGRVRPELEDLIGFFVNTLVLRTDLSGQPGFAEVVERVRTVSLGAYAHQELPFEVVVERLQPTRDLSRTPLFQVMFALQNMPRAAVELPDLTLEPIAPDLATAQFDLSLTLVEEADGLHGQVEYRTDLFAPATIAQLIEHYQALLAAVVVDPSQSIPSLPPLTHSEQQRLADWNTVAAQPHEQHFHALFASHATRSPDAIAVIQGAQSLTYGRLNARANRLAHYLRARGVGGAQAETVVGVCLPSCVDLIVAVLAIFKAGATYLPLDPGAPADRLDFMLQDVQAALVITNTAHRSRVPQSATPVVCLDAEQAEIERAPAAEPELSIDPDMLAYIIYTSGSTGRPKGVGIGYGALARHIRTMREVYELSAQDRVLKFAAPSFDVSIEEIAWPLSGGACMIIRDAELWTPQIFTEIIARMEMTVVHLPPVYYRAWVQTFTADTVVPPSLRLVTVGGEALTPEIVQLWQQTAFRKIRLINAYGPTETTITATVADLSADDYAGSKRRSLPIGRTIGGRTAYIVGNDGALTPLGIPGELWLGGANLARGYLNRPELTATQFVPDPFGKTSGSRLYRTGDLARFLADGSIEYLGRIDQQVKVRGYRIELGEIEAALRQHSAIRDAAVVVRQDRLGEARLVAYVEQRTKEQRTKEQNDDQTALIPPSPVATEVEADRGSGKGGQGGESLLPTLRAFLRDRLPEYMVPSAFMFLDALPLTPSEKIDRNALPAVDLDQLGQRSEFVAPRTPTETKLAGIWAEVLHLEQAGIHDDFFALGGHSLLATQVIARIRELFQLELAVRTLFEHPTIAGLAQHIDREQWPAVTPGAEIDSDDEEEWEI